MKLNLLLLLFIFFSKFSFAVEKTVDPNLIHKNLRCLVCQGQSISGLKF
jgi:cytochrome c-type biogenesis protein CcmH/NrfF